MNKLSVALVILTFSAAAQAGDARTPPEMADKVMARLDGDRDGKISPREAASAPKLARRFEAIDENKDGFLTRAELVAALERARGRGGARP